MSPNSERPRGTVIVVGPDATGHWLRSQLKDHRYQVLSATEETLFTRLEAVAADLILLLPSASTRPKGGGKDDSQPQSICQQLQHHPATCEIPVVVVAARVDAATQEAARKAAFMAGAADYMVVQAHKAEEPVSGDTGSGNVGPLALLTRLDQHLAIVKARRGEVTASLSSDTGTALAANQAHWPTGLHQTLNFSDLLKQVVHCIQAAQGEAKILQATIDELGSGLHLAGAVAIIREPGSANIRAGYLGKADCHPPAGSLKAVERATGPLRQPNIVLPMGNDSIQFCYEHPLWGPQIMLVCAIADGQGLLGDLRLSFPATRHLTPEEICLAQHAADQCAIAIRQTRLYETAQEQVELLEGLHRQKDDFLSTVSHELRSPVTNMKMAIQMLTMSLEKVAEGATIGAADGGTATPPIAMAKLKQYLQILGGECDREIDLINNLLDLQRLDAGMQPSTVAQVALGSWLAGVIQPFKERMGDRQQALLFQPLTPLPAFKTDVAAVQRVLTELLDNACKYTPVGGAITVTARMVDHALQLQVINSGVEIPPQHLPYIFDKFYRVPRNDHWQNGGTGLGLAFVKRLVSDIGGTVQVHSHGDKTSFRLMIPELPG